MGSSTAQAWGALDRQITALAPGVVIAWPRVAHLTSADVAAVVDRDTGHWNHSRLGLTRNY
jgi:hypothetical protein